MHHKQHKKNIWIIGGGHFGRRAALMFSRHQPAAAITLVDKLPKEKFQPIPGVRYVCGDGITFLKSHLDNASRPPDWIIPAIPIHLAFEWIKNKHGQALSTISVPDTVSQQLPNPFSGPEKAMFFSHADFLCPDNCPEPADHCTYTGKPRPIDLFRLLEKVECPPFTSIVIRSRQVFPGVGGYHPRSLFDALNRIRLSSGPFLISTACRCHAVMHAFEKQ